MVLRRAVLQTRWLQAHPIRSSQFAAEIHTARHANYLAQIVGASRAFLVHRQLLHPKPIRAKAFVRFYPLPLLQYSCFCLCIIYHAHILFACELHLVSRISLAPERRCLDFCPRIPQLERVVNKSVSDRKSGAGIVYRLTWIFCRQEFSARRLPRRCISQVCGGYDGPIARQGVFRFAQHRFRPVGQREQSGAICAISLSFSPIL